MKRTMASSVAGLLVVPFLAVAASPPPVSITLGGRHGHVTPERSGFTHTGGGNIDVQQPSPDTIVVTMTGVAVAGGHPYKHSSASMKFELDQCFEINFDDPKVKAAKLSMEGRVIGLLRSHGCCAKKCNNSAEECGGCATIGCGGDSVLTLCVPDHSVACGENLSLNCTPSPVNTPVMPGSYVLHQAWSIAATHGPGMFCKAASAEFAPDPALDPLWISYWEPFHGATKKDFGFQITIKVEDDSPKENGNGNGKANGNGKIPEIKK